MQGGEGCEMDDRYGSDRGKRTSTEDRKLEVNADKRLNGEICSWPLARL